MDPTTSKSGLPFSRRPRNSVKAPTRTQNADPNQRKSLNERCHFFIHQVTREIMDAASFTPTDNWRKYQYIAGVGNYQRSNKLLLAVFYPRDAG